MFLSLCVVVVLVVYYFHVYIQNINYQIELSLASQRNFVTNIKLSSGHDDVYLWRMALNCKTLHKKQEIGLVGHKRCVPMRFSFLEEASQSQNSTALEYSFLPQDKKVYFLENIQKPCLICHASHSNSLVAWEYNMQSHKADLDNMLVAHNKNQLVTYLFFYCLTLSLAWVLFWGLRMIYRLNNGIGLVAFVILKPQASGGKLFLNSIALPTNKFVYLELGHHYVRGYLFSKDFVAWLKHILHTDMLIASDFRGVKGVGIQVPLENGFEGLRIAHMMLNKTQTSEFLVDSELMVAITNDENKLNTKKLFWQVNPHEKRLYKFLKIG